MINELLIQYTLNYNEYLCPYITIVRGMVFGDEEKPKGIQLMSS